MFTAAPVLLPAAHSHAARTLTDHRTNVCFSLLFMEVSTWRADVVLCACSVHVLTPKQQQHSEPGHLAALRLRLRAEVHSNSFACFSPVPRPAIYTLKVLSMVRSHNTASMYVKITQYSTIVYGSPVFWLMSP
jgi:hypothetical protein